MSALRHHVLLLGWARSSTVSMGRGNNVLSMHTGPRGDATYRTWASASAFAYRAVAVALALPRALTSRVKSLTGAITQVRDPKMKSCNLKP